jgi:uncharacterized membrane protein
MSGQLLMLRNMALVIGLFSGSIFILLGWPLAERKVGPNGGYGFRTPATLADEELWYRVNEAAGRGLVISGVVVLLAMLVLWPVLDGATYFAAVMGLVVLCPLTVVGVVSRKYLR